jgi:hypothetical protein
MNKKDIALTAGGTVATMLLSWLFYRRQRDQAAAQAQATTDQAAQDATATAATDPYNTQLAQEWLQAGSLASSASSGTTTAAPSSASSLDLGGNLVDTSEANQLIANIVAAYTPTPATASSLDLGGPLDLASITPEQLAAMTIPAITGTVQTATGNIPTTAQDAAAQAMLAVAPTLYNFAMDSSDQVSSHPVDAHPTLPVYTPPTWASTATPQPYSPGSTPVYIPGTNTLDPYQPMHLVAQPITQANAQ